MKKLLLLILLITFASSYLMAQEDQPKKLTYSERIKARLDNSLKAYENGFKNYKDTITVSRTSAYSIKDWKKAAGSSGSNVSVSVQSSPSYRRSYITRWPITSVSSTYIRSSYP